MLIYLNISHCFVLVVCLVELEAVEVQVDLVDLVDLHVDTVLVMDPVEVCSLPIQCLQPSKP